MPLTKRASHGSADDEAAVPIFHHRVSHHAEIFPPARELIFYVERSLAGRHFEAGTSDIAELPIVFGIVPGCACEHLFSRCSHRGANKVMLLGAEMYATHVNLATQCHLS